jgi:hypothetical protein
MTKFFEQHSATFSNNLNSNLSTYSIESLQNEIAVKSQFSEIENVGNMIDVAVKDAETLIKVQDIAASGVNQPAMEQISLLVENICHRQGMIFRPKYFAMEGVNIYKNNYAVEGVGSFIKSVIDAIIKAIKKMIEWVTNLFTGGKSGSGINAIKNKIEKSETILNAVTPQLEHSAKQKVLQLGFTEAIGKQSNLSKVQDNQSKHQSVKKPHETTGRVDKLIHKYLTVLKHLNHNTSFKESVEIKDKLTSDYLKHMHECAKDFTSINIGDLMNGVEAGKFNALFEKMFSRFQDHKTSSGKISFSTAFCDVEIAAVSDDMPMTMVMHLKPPKKLSVSEDDVQDFVKETTKQSLEKIIQLSKIRLNNLTESGDKYKTALESMRAKLNKVADENAEETAKKDLLDTSKVLVFVTRLLGNSIKEVDVIVSSTEEACQLYATIIESA